MGPAGAFLSGIKPIPLSQTRSSRATLFSNETMRDDSVE